MLLTSDQQRVKSLLTETITLLCKNGLNFKTEFCIEGILGITVDKQNVFLVSINEIIQSAEHSRENANKAPPALKRQKHTEKTFHDNSTFISRKRPRISEGTRQTNLLEKPLSSCYASSEIENSRLGLPVSTRMSGLNSNGIELKGSDAAVAQGMASDVSHPWDRITINAENITNSVTMSASSKLKDMECPSEVDEGDDSIKSAVSRDLSNRVENSCLQSCSTLGKGVDNTNINESTTNNFEILNTTSIKSENMSSGNDEDESNGVLIKEESLEMSDISQTDLSYLSFPNVYSSSGHQLSMGQDLPLSVATSSMECGDSAHLISHAFQENSESPQNWVSDQLLSDNTGEAADVSDGPERRVTFSRTSHGHLSTVYKGHGFRKNRIYKNGSIQWRCRQNQRFKCRATITTRGEVVIGHEPKHSHPPVE